MAPGTSEARRPTFLHGVTAPVVRRPAFVDLDGPAPGAQRNPTPPPSAPMAPDAEATQVDPAETAQQLLQQQQQQPAPPPPPSPPPPPPPIDLSRLESAIERLHLQADRLAAEVRADALELALVLARKIVEGEVTVNVDRVIAMARTAVRRLGESRRVVVKLSPDDAQALTARQAASPLAPLNAGSALQVEIVGDPALGRGDCLVEGDLGAVDGRLDTRLAELRRILAEATQDGEGAE
jgi:flagellar assembly protein FliH